jgi:hypothetical protein
MMAAQGSSGELGGGTSSGRGISKYFARRSAKTFSCATAPNETELSHHWRGGAWQRRRTGRARPLHVVIHRELVRVGAETQCVVFLLFHVDPVSDEVFVEDVATQQEGMIGLKRFDRAA